MKEFFRTWKFYLFDIFSLTGYIVGLIAGSLILNIQLIPLYFLICIIVWIIYSLIKTILNRNKP